MGRYLSKDGIGGDWALLMMGAKAKLAFGLRGKPCGCKKKQQRTIGSLPAAASFVIFGAATGCGKRFQPATWYRSAKTKWEFDALSYLGIWSRCRSTESEHDKGKRDQHTNEGDDAGDHKDGPVTLLAGAVPQAQRRELMEPLVGRESRTPADMDSRPAA